MRRTSKVNTTSIRVASLAIGLLGLGACTSPYDPGQRAVAGGFGGAAEGAAIGAAVGIPGGPVGMAAGAAIGGAIGGAGGATVGAATTPLPPGYAPYGPYAQPQAYAPQPVYVPWPQQQPQPPQVVIYDDRRPEPAPQRVIIEHHESPVYYEAPHADYYRY